MRRIQWKWIVAGGLVAEKRKRAREASSSFASRLDLAAGYSLLSYGSGCLSDCTFPAGAAHEPHAHDGARAMPLHARLNPTLERIEREMVKAALHKHRGRMDDAAKALGISRKGLYLKRQRLGL